MFNSKVCKFRAGVFSLSRLFCLPAEHVELSTIAGVVGGELADETAEDKLNRESNEDNEGYYLVIELD